MNQSRTHEQLYPDVRRRDPWRPSRSLLVLIVATLWSAAALPTSAQPAPANAPPLPGIGPLGGAGDDFQVLDRGPIHEAFAEPIVDAALQGERPEAIVPREPPEPINELAPDARPEGANVQWIPGYWMWSPDQQDFVWVSGVWRDAPPGRRWVPGHWSQVGGGFLWTPGFWIDDGAAEIAFLPAPPASLEQGPSSPAPGDGFFWIPGCWVHQNNAYAWRAGYWYQGQENWVWTPAYYSYTPRGFVYVHGYWDRPLVRRGFLYASVYWRTPVYRRAGFAYRPRSVVNTSLLIANLFVNPYRSHYYYGGFGPSYAQLGYYPWHAFHAHGPRYYDPLFAYYRWHDGRGRSNWYANLKNQYRRFDNWDRPGQGRGGPGRGNGPHAHGPRRGELVLSSYQQLRQRGVNVATRRVSTSERARINANVDQWRKFTQRRAQAAANPGAVAGRGGRGPNVQGNPIARGGNPDLATRGPNGASRGGRGGPTGNRADNGAGQRTRGQAGNTAVAGRGRSGADPTGAGTRVRASNPGAPANGSVAGNAGPPGRAGRQQVFRLPGDNGLMPGGSAPRTGGQRPQVAPRDGGPSQRVQSVQRTPGRVQSGRPATTPPVRGNASGGAPWNQGRPRGVVRTGGAGQAAAATSGPQPTTSGRVVPQPYRPGQRAALPGGRGAPGAATSPSASGGGVRERSGGAIPRLWGGTTPRGASTQPAVRPQGRTVSPSIPNGRAGASPATVRARGGSGQPAVRRATPARAGNAGRPAVQNGPGGSRGGGAPAVRTGGRRGGNPAAGRTRGGGGRGR